MPQEEEDVEAEAEEERLSEAVTGVLRSTGPAARLDWSLLSSVDPDRVERGSLGEGARALQRVLRPVAYCDLAAEVKVMGQGQGLEDEGHRSREELPVGAIKVSAKTPSGVSRHWSTDDYRIIFEHFHRNSYAYATTKRSYLAYLHDVHLIPVIFSCMHADFPCAG